MTIDFKTFQSFIADELCFQMDCHQCCRFFDIKQCPRDKCDNEDKVMLAKTLYMIVKNAVENEGCITWTEDEFMRLLRDD